MQEFKKLASVVVNYSTFPNFVQYYFVGNTYIQRDMIVKTIWDAVLCLQSVLFTYWQK